MDAPPKGPEEGLIFPADVSPSRNSRLIVSAFDLLATADGAVDLVVAGTSMLPTLSPGDRVRVELDPRRRRFGDLIVFLQGDSVVVHRYLGPASDRSGRPCLRSRGDARRELDPPLLAENLLGTVVTLRRDGAWRRLGGVGARAYAAAVAVHDLFWAGAAHLAGRSGSLGIGRAVERLDAYLLKIVDASFFKLFHPRVAAPGAPRAPEGR